MKKLYVLVPAVTTVAMTAQSFADYSDGTSIVDAADNAGNITALGNAVSSNVQTVIVLAPFLIALLFGKKIMRFVMSAFRRG